MFELVGIPSIHLLKTFIDIQHYAEMDDQGMFVVGGQVVLHLMFLISALFVTYTAKVSESING